jgi:non-specific serine/threonine protein kinase/serine/threonine-protein kinase
MWFMSTNSNIDSIFCSAVEIQSREARDIFVQQACGGDKQLLDQLARLLHAHFQGGSILDSPAEGLDATIQQPIAEKPGTIIGPYKLLQQIGEGGMGVVFMAEQSHPIHRTVALKIIKPGMDTRQVIARFEAERQALALMDHPNIAKVLDAGTTGEGVGCQVSGVREMASTSSLTPDTRHLTPGIDRPYFVMELVKGVPITKYCDEKRLPLRARLELLLPVCQAVQHAHQKGIIHRDIKPTNVLVAEYDNCAVPKVIDFGVAKATAQKLTERTMFTEFGQLVGTFEYMSPEQAKLNQLDIDTRSDIYSLGVLLYELLTGSTPFDKQRFETVAFDETLRIIREEEPPKPSTRLSSLSLREKASVRVPSLTLPPGVERRERAMDSATIAANRQSEPGRLTKELRGDLDWIVMKALEKERERRYETASALAADVSHYLAHEPVTAAAPSPLYRLAKFAKRNRASVFAGAAVMAGLLACVIGMWMALVSQSRQRAAAERERAQALLNLATALHSQGRFVEAEESFRTGLKSVGDASAEDEQRAAHARLHLARVVYELGDRVEAEQLYREALAAFRASFPPGDPAIAHAQISLALILRTDQRFDEAEALLREAFDIYRRATPTDHRVTGTSATHLANVLITLRKYVEAEPIARLAVAEHQAAVPIDHMALAFARVELGRDLIALRKYREAEAELLEAERILSPATDSFHVGILAPIALYSTWNQAEPGKGYDAKAQQWTRKLIGTYIRLEELWPDISTVRQQAPTSPPPKDDSPKTDNSTTTEN